MLESFPLDTYWCETRVEEQIENSIVRNSDSIHSLRIKLKRHNRHLRKELRILKKVESLLQDQASKLEVEKLLLKGVSTTLPRQQWQDYI